MKIFGFFLLFLLAVPVFSQTPNTEAKVPRSSQDCSDMEVWDIPMGMCMPLAMRGMPMKMFMLDGDAFLTEITESGPRGRTDYGIPNMAMMDLGSSVGDHHYFNLDVMGTFERWTFPYSGYPELLQIGENNAQGNPFIDAQHPHSSPIMGLTLSDTIRLNDENKDHLKVFFAPRGESTDGPIAFMHRATGVINPDAPLGHHIGQDVGHISSTVLGGSLTLGSTRIEASLFNGTEPEPDIVDLQMGTLNSYAFRLMREFSPKYLAMASIAEVKNSPGLADTFRYSASMYTNHDLGGNWLLLTTSVFGLTTNYDNTSSLSSFLEEYSLKSGASDFWGRIEVLQRTASELNIASQNTGQWIQAYTVGYSHLISNWQNVDMRIGGSFTMDVLTPDFSSTYGSYTPLTAKVFLQCGGKMMLEL